MKRSLIALLLTSVLTVAAHGAGGYKVVVHPSNGRTTITRAELGRIFMKKLLKWENGTPVVPVDLQEKSPVRQSFTTAIHGKSVSAVRSYWQQQIFSGRDVPPVEKSSDAQVLAFVRQNPGAIGYVADAADTSGLDVLTVQ